MNSSFRRRTCAAVAVALSATAQVAFGAPATSCARYGIIQVVGRSPTQTSLQVVVLGAPGQRKTIILPASSATTYKPGQRICVDPPPTK